MELKELQKHWDTFGETDPLWAIVACEDKRFGRWDLGDFFKNGQVQVDGALGKVREEGFSVNPRGTALDFGCGVGRLTQALCAHFDDCVGVDIAPSMIKQADAYNRFGDRCRYVLNDKADLSVFPDDAFDFIYTSIVLQHMEPKYSKAYLGEFVRVLKPGGLAVCHIPTAQVAVRDGARKFTSEHLCRGPLPPTAWRAEIAAVDLPATMVAGSKVKLTVDVRNAGDTTWLRGGALEGQFWINLANQWTDALGNYVAYDDGRSPLIEDVAPGATTRMPLFVTAPGTPGRHVLELDVVQEHVAWFGLNGSKRTNYPVAIVAAEAGEAPAAEVIEPRAEMYGVPESEVRAVIEGAGGKVLLAKQLNEPEIGFIEHEYFFSK